jgi:UDP-N-acetylmuramoyl-L-alanyl-D-glutamate--2,6-diaminopimelate ligase
MLDSLLSKTRRVIPRPIFEFFNPAYHWTLAFVAALWYRFPSRYIKVIAVTGTKGKSSTTEILNAILEEAGYKTALSNTIRFKVGDLSSDNLYKMSMPGRFFTQRLLRKAVNAKCDYAIIEMTSQGAITYRHFFIDLDVFVLTNISPEHIEAHGSYEKYVEAKLSIARRLAVSKKKNRTLIVNADDRDSRRFMECAADKHLSYGIRSVDPYQIGKEDLSFSFGGRTVHSHLSGLFNLYNILAAITAAQSQGVPDDVAIRAVEGFAGIRGRVEHVEAGQDFTVVVDYAHTPDSLEKLYQVFQHSRNICVLGGTGGGRDTWKRSEMGRIADIYCDHIILTNEDPYDEDPRGIVEDVAKGMSHPPTIIMDRRLAIREALKWAQTGDAVIITGKGTDPYIMGPNGTKKPWSDAKVVAEELATLIKIKM